MADRYLIETSATDGYLLEDGSGVLLLETPASAPNLAFDEDNQANKDFTLRPSVALDGELALFPSFTPKTFTDAIGIKKQPYFVRTPAMFGLLEDTGLVPIVPSVTVPNLPLDEDYHGGKDFRWALFALLDDELAPQPFSPTLAWDEIEWNRFLEQTRITPDENQPGLIPIIPVPPPTLGWDDWDWSRHYSTAYAKPPEPEPFDFTPPIVPSLSWFDETQQIYGMTGLSALVVLDEFVNAPAGSIPFGPAPSGRSVRFGFSISAFR